MTNKSRTQRDQNREQQGGNNREQQDGNASREQQGGQGNDRLDQGSERNTDR